MAITPISTSMLNGNELCKACRAGGQVSFNRPYYLSEGSAEARQYAASFEHWQSLRYGSLWRCRVCDRPWHLDSAGVMMTLVPEGRLDLVLAWNAAEILLPDQVIDRLGEIGPTPPDVYGNGGDYVQIPCGVLTKAGERVDAAIVSLQHSAPIEAWRPSRLGSEIAEIYPSPYALPLEVRLSTTRAGEIRMGFAPSLIAMPDGRRFLLNWTTNFFDEPGYRAADARDVSADFDWDDMPPLAGIPATTWFVADG